jgi:hypothetical protein
VQTFAVYKTLKCCDNAHAPVRRPVSKSMGIQCSGHARPRRGIPGAVMPAKGWIGRYIRNLGLACDIFGDAKDDALDGSSAVVTSDVEMTSAED